MVNPIFDGMNLIAKEAPLVNERDGVMILSENAGAHEELGLVRDHHQPLRRRGPGRGAAPGPGDAGRRARLPASRRSSGSCARTTSASGSTPSRPTSRASARPTGGAAGSAPRRERPPATSPTSTRAGGRAWWAWATSPRWCGGPWRRRVVRMAPGSARAMSDGAPAQGRRGGRRARGGDHGGQAHARADRPLPPAADRPGAAWTCEVDVDGGRGADPRRGRDHRPHRGRDGGPDGGVGRRAERLRPGEGHRPRHRDRAACGCSRRPRARRRRREPAGGHRHGVGPLGPRGARGPLGPGAGRGGGGLRAARWCAASWSPTTPTGCGPPAGDLRRGRTRPTWC